MRLPPAGALSCRGLLHAGDVKNCHGGISEVGHFCAEVFDLDAALLALHERRHEIRSDIVEPQGLLVDRGDLSAERPFVDIDFHLERLARPHLPRNASDGESYLSLSIIADCERRPVVEVVDNESPLARGDTPGPAAMR